jgi:hypothetical protein
MKPVMFCRNSSGMPRWEHSCGRGGGGGEGVGRGREVRGWGRREANTVNVVDAGERRRAVTEATVFCAPGVSSAASATALRAAAAASATAVAAASSNAAADALPATHLDEVRALERRLGEEDAVVGDDAEGHAVQAREACAGGRCDEQI